VLVESASVLAWRRAGGRSAPPARSHTGEARIFSGRITSAHLVALISLTPALGGVAYASQQAAKNSLTSSSIKNGAVPGVDVTGDTLDRDPRRHERERAELDLDLVTTAAATANSSFSVAFEGPGADPQDRSESATPVVVRGDDDLDALRR
jgi:hypothetical protein